jgi:hypothetical protein
MKYLQTAGGTQTNRVFSLPGTCDICRATRCPTIYDASVLVNGRWVWAWTCPECFALHNGGLGVGRGQEYKSSIDTGNTL